jgi:hypothetical protein
VPQTPGRSGPGPTFPDVRSASPAAVDVPEERLVSLRLAGPASDLRLEALDLVPWSSPTSVVIAFLALVGLVIVLGRSSTARFEFDRNCADVRTREHAVAAVSTGRAAAPAMASTGAPALDGGLPAPVPAGSGGHPAGRAIATRTATWWLVDDEGDDRAPEVIAGPFDDRIDAEWAALASGLAAGVRPAYGVLRSDGALARRQPTAERTWLVELGLQLSRLPSDWDAFLSDTDELGTLVVEVGEALLEAGLPLYDCAALWPEEGDPTGGVCLVPDPGSGGILVSWRAHDRMAVQQLRGTSVGDAVHRAMTAALGDVLAQLGFDVRPLPSGAGHLVVPDVD